MPQYTIFFQEKKQEENLQFVRMVGHLSAVALAKEELSLPTGRQGTFEWEKVFPNPEQSLAQIKSLLELA